MELRFVLLIVNLTVLIAVAEDLTVTINTKTWRTGYSQQVIFYCLVEGDHYYETQWYKDQSRIETSESHRIWIHSLYLDISWIVEDDEGEYTCKVNNTMHTAQDTATLFVLDPIINDEINDEETIECKKGKDVILPCTLNGLRKDQVKWISNYGQEINVDKNTSPDPRYILVTSANSEINLKIQGAKTGDSGVYRCMSKTSNQQMKSISLNVLVVPEFIGKLGYYIKESYTEGNDVLFDCQVIGNPDPTITWSKALPRKDVGIVFIPKNVKLTGSRYVILANNSLYIRNITKADQTNYTCSAENSIGSTSRFVELKVHTMPKVSVSPSSTSAKIGETVSFECIVSWGSDEEFGWYKDGQEKAIREEKGHLTMQTDNDDVELHRILTLTSVQQKDAGTYRCKAENLAGTAEDSVTLYIPDTDPTKQMLVLLQEIVEQQKLILEALKDD